ncbi:uncharacterized protein LOC100838017 isoform X2 [Brachypodium distachyon]|uniref:uncharacterized protein LOC100838017 isoform X2 n=1 Tax=Brachypodium distachyon TaxID=15368 RepID=UPI0006E490EA|nr:uncharacterized protein LOC100838017 isoform X2 [Brachypodium distachyon]|eukprot:XP_024316561.1 uncharacterized protein LOC100838017 isoform X2 [Brachypodium distachyon]
MCSAIYSEALLPYPCDPGAAWLASETAVPMAASPSAPPSLLLRLRAPPCRSSGRSLCILAKRMLQPFPSEITGRRRVAATVVDKLAPRRQETRRLPWTGGFACRCSYDPGSEPPAPPSPPPGESLDEWPVLRRWDVPWEWPTISLTMVACAVSSLLTGMVEKSGLEYLGYQAGEATIDEKAGVLFLGQFVTAVVLGVIFGITNTFRPFSDDIFRYDFKEPFKLPNGWLLWAGIGLFFAVIFIALTGAAMTFLNGEAAQRETDSLVLLLPLIGSSNISTAYLLGITGVLAPILEETVFRGFLMVSLNMWFSTPVSVLITAAVFAFAHLTPGEFSQLFVLGVALGFSYAQSRNLLTPIMMHAIWNSGVIVLLTFLQLQGYNIKELLQAS